MLSHFGNLYLHRYCFCWERHEGNDDRGCLSSYPPFHQGIHRVSFKSNPCAFRERCLGFSWSHIASPPWFQLVSSSWCSCYLQEDAMHFTVSIVVSKSLFPRWEVWSLVCAYGVCSVTPLLPLSCWHCHLFSPFPLIVRWTLCKFLVRIISRAVRVTSSAFLELMGVGIR